jgi:hypothetical protein
MSERRRNKGRQRPETESNAILRLEESNQRKLLVANSHYTHQGFLDVDELALALVFFLGAVGKSFLQQNQVAAEFELCENQAAQGFERVFLIGREFAGRAIDDAERAEGEAILIDERSAGIEADVRVGNDQRIVAKAIIGQGVRDDKELALQNSCGTKSDVARSFRCLDAYARLKPLAVFVDERNQRDGCLANKRGKKSEVVERLFRVAIKDGVFLEGGDAGFLIGWLGGDHEQPPALSLGPGWFLAGAESYSKLANMARPCARIQPVLQVGHGFRGGWR